MAAAAYTQDLKRGFALAAQLEAALKASEEKEQKAQSGRKALLPGFEGHRARCACLLCQKRRRDGAQLIAATKSTQAAFAAASAPPPPPAAAAGPSA
jgi:hypothetical protein